MQCILIKKAPKTAKVFGVEYLKKENIQIISLRTEVHDGRLLNRISFFPSFSDHE